MRQLARCAPLLFMVLCPACGAGSSSTGDDGGFGPASSGSGSASGASSGSASGSLSGSSSGSSSGAGPDGTGTGSTGSSGDTSSATGSSSGGVADAGGLDLDALATLFPPPAPSDAATLADGMSCGNLGCFDVFDCAIYHAAQFGPCGFTKCVNLICQ